MWKPANFFPPQKVYVVPPATYLKRENCLWYPLSEYIRNIWVFVFNTRTILIFPDSHVPWDYTVKDTHEFPSNQTNTSESPGYNKVETHRTNNTFGSLSYTNLKCRTHPIQTKKFRPGRLRLSIPCLGITAKRKPWTACVPCRVKASRSSIACV